MSHGAGRNPDDYQGGKACEIQISKGATTETEVLRFPPASPRMMFPRQHADHGQPGQHEDNYFADEGPEVHEATHTSATPHVCALRLAPAIVGRFLVRPLWMVFPFLFFFL